MTMSIEEAAINLAVAFGLSAAIGFERQWRNRLAGLRTNTLVALGAASFVVFAALVPGEGSPTRVAAQVVSGIGFLGAGLIFRASRRSRTKASIGVRTHWRWRTEGGATVATFCSDQNSRSCCVNALSAPAARGLAFHATADRTLRSPTDVRSRRRWFDISTHLRKARTSRAALGVIIAPSGWISTEKPNLRRPKKEALPPDARSGRKTRISQN